MRVGACKRRYLIDALMLVNLVLSFVPRPFTAAIIANAIPAAISHIL